MEVFLFKWKYFLLVFRTIFQNEFDWIFDSRSFKLILDVFYVIVNDLLVSTTFSTRFTFVEAFPLRFNSRKNNFLSCSFETLKNGDRLNLRVRDSQMYLPD